MNQNFMPTLKVLNFAGLSFCKCQELIWSLNFARIKFKEEKAKINIVQKNQSLLKFEECEKANVAFFSQFSQNHSQNCCFHCFFLLISEKSQNLMFAKWNTFKLW